MYLHVVVCICIQVRTDTGKFTDDAVTNISKGVNRDADGGNRHRESVMVTNGPPSAAANKNTTGKSTTP